MGLIMDILYLLIPLAPIIISIVCAIKKKGKIISLIATLCGVLPAMFFLMLNSGYGIGFGNPWIGVDWAYTLVLSAYIIFVLFLHIRVPASDTARVISRIVTALIIICLVLIIGGQITGTIDHMH